MRPALQEARVAFVILCWNSEQYIKRCLDSVLSLRCAKLDVYVEDNGSNDSTESILDSYIQNYQNVHVEYLKRNCGTTVSRNRAIKQIDKNTDYVCILDSDTVMNQEALEILAEVLAEDLEIGVVGPRLVNSRGEVQLSGRNLPTLGIKLGKACPIKEIAHKASIKEQPDSPIVDGLQNVGYLLSACWFIPKSTLDRVGLLDEHIFYAPEDVDWCIRVHEIGLRVVLCNRATIIHEYQRLSHKKLFSKTNIEHVKGLIYYFSKYRYLFRLREI